jgi:hypothetical protein
VGRSCGHDQKLQRNLLEVLTYRAKETLLAWDRLGSEMAHTNDKEAIFAIITITDI